MRHAAGDRSTATSETTTSLDVVDHLLVNGCVRPIGDEALGVLELVVLVPHHAGIPYDYGHRCVDDNIEKHVLRCVWSREV